MHARTHHYVYIYMLPKRIWQYVCNCRSSHVCALALKLVLHSWKGFPFPATHCSWRHRCWRGAHPPHNCSFVKTSPSPFVAAEMDLEHQRPTSHWSFSITLDPPPDIELRGWVGKGHPEKCLLILSTGSRRGKLIIEVHRGVACAYAIAYGHAYNIKSWSVGILCRNWFLINMALSRIVSIAAQLAVVVVLIALSGTSSQAAEDAPRAPDNQHKEECRFIVHNETIDKDGCVATLPLISCAGNCNSDATPKIFYSRYCQNTSLPSWSDCVWVCS